MVLNLVIVQIKQNSEWNKILNIWLVYVILEF